MNKKVKFILLGLCTLMLGALFLFNMDGIKADSGWDVDFDTGGSDWGSSDWGSSDWRSSDWDHDYSHSSSGVSGSGSSFAIVFIIIVIVIIIYAASKTNGTSASRYIPIIHILL